MSDFICELLLFPAWHISASGLMRLQHKLSSKASSSSSKQVLPVQSCGIQQVLHCKQFQTSSDLSSSNFFQNLPTGSGSSFSSSSSRRSWSSVIHRPWWHVLDRRISLPWQPLDVLMKALTTPKSHHHLVLVGPVSELSWIMKSQLRKSFHHICNLWVKDDENNES